MIYQHQSKQVQFRLTKVDILDKPCKLFQACGAQYLKVGSQSGHAESQASNCPGACVITV